MTCFQVSHGWVSTGSTVNNYQTIMHLRMETLQVGKAQINQQNVCLVLGIYPWYPMLLLSLKTVLQDLYDSYVTYNWNGRKIIYLFAFFCVSVFRVENIETNNPKILDTSFQKISLKLKYDFMVIQTPDAYKHILSNIPSYLLIGILKWQNCYHTYFIVKKLCNMSKKFKTEVHWYVLSINTGYHTLGCIWSHLSCLWP